MDAIVPVDMRVQQRIVAAGDRVAGRFRTHFDALLAAGSPDIRDRHLGFAGPNGELGPNNTPWPAAPFKYAIDVRAWVERHSNYLPFFAGVTSAFELGVGPGILFTLLKDALGIRISGIDVDVDRLAVFRAMRDELGISSLVSEHCVTAYRDIPIPAGTDAVVAFWTMFDLEWGVSEHRWFVDHCRAKEARRLFFRFNKTTPSDDVRAFYESVGGRFQKASKVMKRKFCIVEL